MNQTAASIVAEAYAGDVPAPRFGHSTTFIGNNQVILFGGAVGDCGHYQITNDVYQLDMTTMKWTKVNADNAPQARAAHGAARVDNMQLVVYGGATGGGSLSSEELYLLDVRKSPVLSWMTVPISGPTPGRRYGHTMVYHKPNLIVFGGNNGQTSLNDIWYMDVEHCPFQWTQVILPLSAKRPPERVYHSAEICREGPACGMMVIFGGRTTTNQSLRDVWGLRQHRNGQWDWVVAPVKKGAMPDARFQHTALFIKTRMFIVGGRDEDVGRPLPTAMYDTEACEWKAIPGMGRFRHSAWVAFECIYTFGGFDHQTQTHPTKDLHKLNPSPYLDGIRKKPASTGTGNKQQQEGGVVAFIGGGLTSTLDGRGQSVGRMRPAPAISPQRQSVADRPLSTPAAGYGDRLVRLSSHVHTKVDDLDFSAMVRKISIDRLGEEAKKIRGHQTPLHIDQGLLGPSQTDELADICISMLLKPDISMSRIDRDYNSNAPFCILWEQVSLLCRRCTEIMRREQMVLNLRAPIKIYGDIHGQYYDLMRLFGSYRCPVDEEWVEDNPDMEVKCQGDIDSNDYLFLGDFVDRGTNSLEVICLLLSLKLKHPKQIHLIRGNHEDPAINSTYGFKEECRRRLSEDPDDKDSCWNRFNTLFEYMPVGALIEDHILCIHGGIGGSISTIQDIAALERPLKVSQVPSTLEEQRVTDLLWSDPTDNDSCVGVVPNDVRDPERTGHIVKFGPDRVMEFLERNRLDLIIRAHECVMDGFERFAGGRLITLFSATDYCNTHKNAGALLFVRRDLTVVPKIIFPAARDVGVVGSSWINLDSRPPTPPRSHRRGRDDFD